MTTKILVLLAVLTLSSCGNPQDPMPYGTTGPTGEQGTPGADGLAAPTAPSCTVAQTSTGALIYCPDGTHAFVQHGKDGSNGKDCKKHK